MDDLNIIDAFLETFVTYIESGFGLLEGDVHWLTSVLVAIDITLAGLFWALMGEDNIIAQFLKKVLYVGTFALIIGNFPYLTDAVFESFAGLGLKATGTSLTSGDLMRPGFIAGTGFTAAHPILATIGTLSGFTTVFANLPIIVVLFLAWIIVLLSFFLMAIQLFIVIIEFKLTTLAGFVLVPFALWNKTSFLAEKVLGNVIASGVKLMVLAVVTGIGATLFSHITGGFGDDISLAEAASIILASLCLLMLSIFSPGIAAGLISGAPQLGAGAAIGTAAGVAAGGTALAVGGIGATKAAASLAASGTRAAASVAGSASAAYGLGKATSEGGSISSGLAGVAKAGGGAMKAAGQHMTSGIRDSFQKGKERGVTWTGGSTSSAPGPTDNPEDNVPTWAKSMKRQAAVAQASTVALHAARDGDANPSGDSPKLSEKE